MRRLAHFLFCLMMLMPVATVLRAQTHEAGALFGIEFEQKIVKRLNFSVEAEGRLESNLTRFDRFALGSSFDYSFWKKRFKVAVGGNYLMYNKLNWLESRGRVFASLAYTQKIKQFSLSDRVRVQSTFFDEKRREVKFNPKTYFRNRLELEYKFFSKPVKLFASGEFFLRLYKKDGCFIDEVRTVAGATWRVDSRNALTFYLRIDNEVQVKKPENVYYIGIAYSIKNQ